MFLDLRVQTQLPLSFGENGKTMMQGSMEELVTQFTNNPKLMVPNPASDDIK
jgi:hypothetical protein